MIMFMLGVCGLVCWSVGFVGGTGALRYMDIYIHFNCKLDVFWSLNKI